jgi:DNA invertase Pin-like site-specific DNA recombinase
MKRIRCAIYTRKSSEEGLEQSFNSLDAQHEACLAYIESQRHEGWRALSTQYDDGGFSGGTMDRPALTQLLTDVEAGRVDTIVVYKVDRLTRSLADFARIVERLEAAGVAFVSVTQQFSTTSSMGRLTLNVLLSFAQFEREVTGERIRDKIAASKQKGIWMGGTVPLGYDLCDRQLMVNPREAEQVRLIYRLYLELKCVRRLKQELDRRGVVSKVRINQAGHRTGGVPFFRGALYCLLKNRLYRGEIAHRGNVYPGQHKRIVSLEVWEAVQVQLATNNQAKRTGVYAKDPSLLAGLLVDDRGHRLTPIHTVRRGKRYRYYVSQAVLNGRTGQPGSISRVPAQELEQQVFHQVEQWLASDRTVLDQLTLPADDVATHARLLAGAKIWKDLRSRQPADLRAFCLASIRRITVQENVLHVALSRSGLRTVLVQGQNTPTTDLTLSTTPEDSEDDISLRINMVLKRSTRGIRLIVPGESAMARPAQPNPTLLMAVARAQVWAEQLRSGEVTSLQAIARVNGVSDGYVGKVLRCACLAPDLVEAILCGRQPPTLTVQRLLGPLPMDWAEQRRVLGQS